MGSAEWVVEGGSPDAAGSAKLAVIRENVIAARNFIVTMTVD